MKKVIKIFLFLFVFFVININTLAIGISKNEITNDINRNHYELVVGDYLCVYKAQDESEYVAIKFEKINSSRYNVIFYVDDEYANSYIFNDFGYLPENLKYDDGVYLIVLIMFSIIIQVMMSIIQFIQLIKLVGLIILKKMI